MRKIKLLSVHNQKLFSETSWQNGLSQLPENHQKRVTKFRFSKDKQASLLGKLLLKNVLDTFFPKISLNDIKYTEYKKPYIEEEFSFNISHSGDYVLLAYALSKIPIGVDIEKMDEKMEVESFNSILTFEEKSRIKKSKIPYKTFYDIWTIKEAVSKADGRGLHFPLQEIQIKEDYINMEQNTWFYKKMKIASTYNCHVICADNFEVDHRIIEVENLYKSIK